ncbi:MAG TPA: hypothetical protein VKT75_10615 [Acidobacteriaceae bacterium]|nr:hypothetical protein [Acidobacteriaceae bacterium]
MFEVRAEVIDQKTGEVIWDAKMPNVPEERVIAAGETTPGLRTVLAVMQSAAEGR